MKLAFVVRTVSIFVFAFALWSMPALSQDMEPMPEPDEEFSEFLDRDLLVDTLMRDDVLQVDAARDARDAAQDALDEAIENEAPPEEIEELKEQLVAAEEALTQEVADFDEERDTIGEQVDEMSDEQVTAMNQKLHNTLNNGLIPVIGSDDVMRILDENFNDEQISAFTKAFEAEAMFVRHAAKFEDKYEATGKAQFLVNAERAEAKAAAEKAKFLAKVDRFATPEVVDPRDSDPMIDDVARDEMLAVARDAARDAVKEARRLAKEASRDAAKESAKALAKDAAKDQAREAAKQLAKAEHGNAGQGLAKGMIK